MSRKSRRNRAKKRKAAKGAAVEETEDAVTDNRFRSTAKVIKVDESLGLVLGWGVVCKEGGQEYFDVQGDHIEEDALVEAAAEFMEHSRVAKEMHAGSERGNVVFAFPLTTEIAKSFGIQTQTTGLMIGMRPDPEMLEKFRSGELRGFSIGGIRLEDEEVSE